ncbi:glycosyltransferase [Acidisoma cellulosilytica]|uniref:Glycosyltransferase n=1 Tax=Acidisoma cellulosilyticum TaxID=2802395 RepID=A0A964E3D0_9PROT|nr:glycosyltransferase [Acidisoma cellulosilyticum]MCB8879723.1 glycosyltransferase [Acidisoma cellulosilyticum]
MDIRPPARRFREAVLRPLRAEVTSGFAQVALAQQNFQDDLVKAQARSDALERITAAMQDRLDALQDEMQRQAHATQGQLDAIHGELQALQQRRIELLDRTGALERDLTASNLSHDADRAAAQADRAKLAEQHAGLIDLASVVQALNAQTMARFRETQEKDSILSGEIASLRQLAAAERESWRERIFRLEKILTQSADSAPAARAMEGQSSPAVAIILPTFNRANFIGEAIESVQAQSFRNWELIIVDDGSTDGTDNAVWYYLSDPRIRLVHQAHLGAAVARNHGIRETTAPLIAYLDSDNLLHPEFLARAVDSLASQPDVDLVYGALISDDHELDRSCILWSPFDRDALLRGNYIDTNTILHRRTLVAQFGGWDEARRRLVDWDLLLRYTAEKPAQAIPVLAARYRRVDAQSISDIVAFEPDDVAIRNKWFPPAMPTRRPRILYAVWHYPQLSEAYVETELRCMLGWGAHVELWRTATGPSRYPTVVPIHEGSLAEAIAAARPDVIHVHWLSFGLTHAAALASSGLPVTLRLHGFDTTSDGLAAWLAHDWAKGVYGYPVQIAQTGLSDPRLINMPVAFDSKLFKPEPIKDRRMVVRAAAALPSKDLDLFLEAARRLPNYRFVLAAVTCHLREEYAAELKATCEGLQSPVELRFDVPHEAVARLVGEGAFYLHTMHPPGAAGATPVGQPISISEAMATGAYCLVRDVPDLTEMIGDAGTSYSNVDDLVAAITATEDWSDQDWQNAQRRSVSRAWGQHADTMIFRPLFMEWMALSAQ